MSKMSEREVRTWMETAAVGDDVTYHTGDQLDGFLVKRVVAGYATDGKLFLWRQRAEGQPGKWEYHARRLSVAAGKVFKMEPLQ